MSERVGIAEYDRQLELRCEALRERNEARGLAKYLWELYIGEYCPDEATCFAKHPWLEEGS